MTIRHRVTIKDVARDAHVSVATVSNWLSGREYGLAPATRDRVAGSAARLGFRPSSVARAMRGQSIRTVGLVVPSVTNPSIPAIVRGAEDRASEDGYSLFLSNIDRHWEKALAHSLAMIDKGVEAIGYAFSVSSLDDAAVQAAVEAGVRIAALVPHTATPGDNVVALDNEAGMEQAVDHLWSLGHRRIGFATNTRVTANGPHRMTGLMASLARRGGALLPLDVATDSMPDGADEWGEIASGRRCGQQLLAGAEHPTAVCAVNDLVAIGVVLAARDLGLDVPDDVSVVGFDELTAGRVLNPSLTTIRVPLYSMGRQLAERMLSGSCTGVRVVPELVIRGSTGARRRAAEGGASRDG